MNITIPIKKLIKESTIYALGPTLQKAVSFFLLPLYTSYLSTSDYGELEFTIAIAAFIVPLIDSGLTSSFWKYSSGGESNRKKVLSNVLFWKMVFSGVVVLLSFLLSFVIGGRALELFSLYSIVLFSQAVLTTVYVEYQSTHKAVNYVFISFTVALITAIANIILITKLGLGVKGVIYGNSLGIIIALIAFAPTYWRFIRFSLDISLLKKMFSYGFPLVFGNLAYLVVSMSNRFFINYFASSSDLGLYAYGNKFATFLNILVIMPFFLGFNPIRWEVYERDDAKEVFAKLYRVIFITLLFCYFCFSAIGLFLGVKITRNPVFIPGLKTTPFLAFSFFLYGLYYFRIMGLLFEKKTGLISVVQVFSAIMNVILNFLLVPKYSYVGAAISLAISYLFMFGMSSFLSQKFYPIVINKKLETLGIILVIVNCIATLITASQNIELLFIPSLVGSVAIMLFLIFQGKEIVFSFFADFNDRLNKKN